MSPPFRSPRGCRSQARDSLAPCAHQYAVAANISEHVGHGSPSGPGRSPTVPDNRGLQVRHICGIECCHSAASDLAVLRVTDYEAPYSFPLAADNEEDTP